MKIALLSAYFHPEKTGIGVTATDCGRFLEALGHEVSVITAMPFFPGWKIYPQYKNKLGSREALGSIKVYRNWLYVPATQTTMSRIAHELSFAFLSFLRVLTVPHDLLICVSPLFSSTFLATFACLVRRKEMWILIKDLQPDTAIELGMLTNRLVIAVTRLMEKWIYFRCDKILVPSEGCLARVLVKGVPREKLAIVPDSIDVAEFAETVRPTPNGFRDEYNLVDKFLVVHSGALTEKHDLETILGAAEILREERDVFFAIVGQGTQEERLRDLISALELENVKIYPLRERELFAEMLHSADVLVMSMRDEVIDVLLPSKLLCYLSTGTPVIAVAHPDSEAAKILARTRSGILVAPSDIRTLADAVMEIRENMGRYSKRARSARAYMVEHFDHAVVLDRYYRPLFEQ